MQISTALASKAQRLVDDGKVSRVGYKGHLYIVEGDTAAYRVHLSYPEEASGRCGCESTAEVCSHIMAASIYALAFPPEPSPVSATDPFEGII